MEFDGTTLWIAHGYKGLFKVTLSPDLKKVLSSKRYTSAQGFPTDDLINVFRIADRLIFTANGGIFEFDAQKDRFMPVNEINDLFGYGTVMADVETDALGNVYFIEQSRLGILRQEKNRQRSLHYSPFNKVKRLWNDDLANVTVLDEQHILIGAKQGFIHYQPDLDQVKEDLPRVFFREIRNRGIEEQVLFSGHGVLGDSTLKFDFDQNSFFFDFGSTHFESENELQFQYPSRSRTAKTTRQRVPHFVRCTPPTGPMMYLVIRYCLPSNPQALLPRQHRALLFSDLRFLVSASSGDHSLNMLGMPNIMLGLPNSYCNLARWPLLGAT